MSTQKIMICGGGTGGHFFSGLAIAEAFLKKYPDYEVNFVGTRLGIEAQYQLKDERMKIEFVQHLDEVLGRAFVMPRKPAKRKAKSAVRKSGKRKQPS